MAKKHSISETHIHNDKVEDPLRRVLDSAKKWQLIAVIGTGVSIGLTNGKIPSWTGLIKNGLQYSLTKGRITEKQKNNWQNQIESSDIDDLLSAAEFIGRKLGAPADPLYGRWLQESFQSSEPINERLSQAIQTLSSSQIPICTLNYDPLLEKVTGLPSIKISEKAKATAWMRRECQAILHLHGHWENPESCILGIRDYESTQTDDIRDLFQINLATFNHLIFIGCGETLADPNFSALISWLKLKLPAMTPQHIALTREDEMAARNADPAWAGFVEPVSYGEKHVDLAEFIIANFSIKAPKPKKPKPTPQTNQVIENYRKFLIRDCGQMTIEGVSADMDTGQRKFDLERLFVPLKVIGCPPDYPQNDPDRAAKLEEWHKKNAVAIPFGVAIKRQKKLALLALPGGGKTLLLKRLAVAYAEPSRRNASNDDLPDFNLLPVLIRCREWRDHIKLPILTLLKNIGDITGQTNLQGFSEALQPLLKTGKVLLLVDGLDEIHNDADRTTFVDHLESFLDEYKTIRFVVTSREAGFNLVAPALSRFCERWRLAPLEEDAVTLLCGHWHRLMNGDSAASIAESKDVAQILIKNSSLRRLAENPLLLTMLLVVKHGAGGLPPDRVSLYGRAVDVLLDTWNIKGHDPLNPKEAVPQLAYVAFQLMCEGKQTATEKELLILLEEAREKHPNIRRYARDSPHEFLKRVELRSSLLLEAGHQIEDGHTVPFYQFRHLTFQEYLTAIAATDGHYKEYQQDDTIITPLKNYLLEEEWKEVIPMVAVLARKRAEPLLIELISKAQDFRSQINSEKHTDFHEERIPYPVGRLVQCFVEEAEASPETLALALQLIAFFARGCKSSDDWVTLCRGPYGKEFYSQAWSLYISGQWSENYWPINSCGSIAAHQKPPEYWISSQGNSEILSLLQASEINSICRGLLICLGIIWNDIEYNASSTNSTIPLSVVEALLFHDNPTVWGIAAWVWSNTYRRDKIDAEASTDVLNRLLACWLNDLEIKNDSFSANSRCACYAISRHAAINRDNWTPILSANHKTQVQKLLTTKKITEKSEDSFINFSAFLVAYYAKNVVPDKKLVSLIDVIRDHRIFRRNDKQWSQILKDLNVTPKNISNKSTRKISA